MYRLTLISAQYADRDLNGAHWDTLSADEPPDAYAEIHVNGDRVATTQVRQDNYSPEWTKSVDVYLTATSVVRFQFYDQDGVSGDDFAGRYDIADLPAAIRSGGRSDTLTGIAVTQVVYAIDPI